MNKTHLTRGESAPRPRCSAHRAAAILLAIVLLLAALPLNAFAADSQEFRFSNYAKEGITFELIGSELVIKNMPSTEAYSSVIVSIIDARGTTYYDEVLRPSADMSVRLSMSGLGDGKYFVELYYWTGGISYLSYIYGEELEFTIKGGVATFTVSPALEKNEKTLAAARTDSAALAYYLAPSYWIQSEDSAIVETARSVTAGLTTDYEKAVALHDWVCNNVWYDYDTITTGVRVPGDALFTLNNRRGVCEGYANLYAALLRAVGIPAKYVIGYGMDYAEVAGWTASRLSGAEDNHAWNEVYIDGRWLVVDTTWNSGNEYRGGKFVRSDGLSGWRYFDATLAAFSIDHCIGIYDDPWIPQQDAPASWAADAVESAKALGILPRYLQIGYNLPMTRAEFCALAVAMFEKLNGEIDGREKFGDTGNINAEKAASIGVVNGVGNGEFAPYNVLRRAAAATMLSRLATALGKPLPQQAPAFADNAKIDSWASDAVGQMQATGIMGGTGGNNFSPSDTYTRQQGIVTIMRLYELMK